MSADIRNYQTSEGLTDDEMAVLLSSRLGRTVSPAGYRIVKGRRDAPAEWLEALSIAPSEPAAPGAPSATDKQPEHGAPDASKGAVLVPGVLPFEPASAKMQIALIYTMAGKGAALPQRRHGTPEALQRAARIESIWALHAPQIADAYIEWAKENATVAHYIGMLTLGGPGGKLIMLHGSMLVQTLLETGAINPNAFVPPTLRTPQETDTIREPDADTDNEPSAHEPTATA
jgi:hypothetical protein